MDRSNSRPTQPAASLAKKPPPRIVAFEPVPARFRPLRPPPYRMDLSEVVSADAMRRIAENRTMVLHCIGDSGGVKRPEVQMLVAKGMERSLENSRASFCYHVGDVVYYTGEIPDYWDQFYEPYEHYPLPIVAIPGNHDGELMTKQSTTLSGFHENFIAPPGTYTHESRESGRMAMSQPYFYWTLTTPYATVIGLYTNVPEHGRIDDTQRDWFHNEMKSAQKDKALIVALHHPVYSFDVYHSGSSTMAKELQDAIHVSRRVPNMVLTGHVHNYQRIEFTSGKIKIPFFVIGCSGYWNLHHIGMETGGADSETGAMLMSGVDTRHGFVTFEISQNTIDGRFTTVPRPQESWSDADVFNDRADHFSYPADPVFLGDGQTIDLLPANGTHLPPERPMRGSRGTGNRSRTARSKTNTSRKKKARKKQKGRKKRR